MSLLTKNPPEVFREFKTQRTAYVSAFSGYMARYYGKRFEDFLGSKIMVLNSRKTSGGF